MIHGQHVQLKYNLGFPQHKEEGIQGKKGKLKGQM
jgi:hypothetical protein